MHLSLAGRLSAALRNRRLVLVIGDPPVSPQLISEALRKVAQGRHVVTIPCGRGLGIEQLSRACGEVAAVAATGGGPAILVGQAAEPAPPLFVFDGIDRLSDQQIDQIREAVAGSAGEGAAVLLAHPVLLDRLKEPSLQPLKEALAAPFHLEEIGDDEGIDFLRHQLQTRQRDNGAHGTNPIVLRGLAALAAAAGVATAFSLALHYMRMSAESPVGPSIGAYSAGPLLVTAPPPSTASPPRAEAAPAKPAPVAPAPGPDRKPSQPTAPAASPPPSSPQSRAESRPSSAEIAALVARGDGFLSAGDIASARLFYERAADAGNAAAALRLGATFDPDFLGRAGVRGTPADPARAASWYRRARDLGEAAAAERLKNLDERPP